MAKIPIFRKFTDAQFLPFGVSNGTADEAFISKAVENTNYLIEHKLHVPPVQETHDGALDGAASGWVSKSAIEADVMLGEIDLTPKGQARVGNKEFRFFSSAFRKDFAKPDGTILTGPYLHHVALVNNPRVKGLVDLAEVKFSEEPAVIVGSNTETGEVIFLSENRTANAETGETMEANFAEEKKAFEARLSEEKSKREILEARLAESERKNARAEFAERVSKVDTMIAKAVEGKKLGADAIKSAKALGVSLLAPHEVIASFADVLTEHKIEVPTADAFALFSDFLANVGPAVPTVPLGGEASEFERNPEGSITIADFSDVKKGERVEAAYIAAKRTNPTLTFNQFRQSLAG